MRCEEIREELSAALDGELPEEVRRAVEAHLAGCPACRKERDLLGGVDRLYRALPREDAPEGFEDTLGRRLAPPAPVRFPRPRRRPVALWPTLAAAALVVVAGGYAYLRFAPPGGFHVAREQASSALDETLEEPPEPGRAKLRGPDFAEQAFERGAAPRAPAAGLAEDAPPMGDRRGRDVANSFQWEGTDKEAGKSDEAAGAAGYRSSRGEVARLHAEAPPATRRKGVEREPLQPPATQELRPEPPGPALGARPEPDGRFLELAGRSFVAKQGRLEEQGYAGEETETVERDSGLRAALVERDPALAGLFERPEEVVFESEGAWYRVPPAPPAPAR